MKETLRRKIDSIVLFCFTSVLEKAGFIKSPEGGFDVSQFVETDVAKLF